MNLVYKIWSHRILYSYGIPALLNKSICKKHRALNTNATPSSDIAFRTRAFVTGDLTSLKYNSLLPDHKSPVDLPPPQSDMWRPLVLTSDDRSTRCSTSFHPSRPSYLSVSVMTFLVPNRRTRNSTLITH